MLDLTREEYFGSTFQQIVQFECPEIRNFQLKYLSENEKDI